VNIWFVSNDPSHLVFNILSTYFPLEENYTLTIAHVTSPDPISSHIFHYDEYILEELTTPDFAWNALHHRVIFLSQEAFEPPSQASICEIDTEDFIPSGNIDWFNNLSLAQMILKKETWPISPPPSKSTFPSNWES
jgi:hypothetical protein